MSYVDEVLEIVQKKNADQPEFLQAVTEVLDSLRPVIEQDEEKYRKLLLDTGSLVVKIYKRNIVLGDRTPDADGKISVFPEDIFCLRNKGVKE